MGKGLLRTHHLMMKDVFADVLEVHDRILKEKKDEKKFIENLELFARLSVDKAFSITSCSKLNYRYVSIGKIDPKRRSTLLDVRLLCNLYKRGLNAFLIYWKRMNNKEAQELLDLYEEGVLKQEQIYEAFYFQVMYDNDELLPDRFHQIQAGNDTYDPIDAETDLILDSVKLKKEREHVIRKEYFSNGTFELPECADDGEWHTFIPESQTFPVCDNIFRCWDGNKAYIICNQLTTSLPRTHMSSSNGNKPELRVLSEIGVSDGSSSFVSENDPDGLFKKLLQKMSGESESSRVFLYTTPHNERKFTIPYNRVFKTDVFNYFRTCKFEVKRFDLSRIHHSQSLAMLIQGVMEYIPDYKDNERKDDDEEEDDDEGKDEEEEGKDEEGEEEDEWDSYIQDLNVKALRNECKKVGIPSSGKKVELIDRLLESKRKEN